MPARTQRMHPCRRQNPDSERDTTPLPPALWDQRVILRVQCGYLQHEPSWSVQSTMPGGSVAHRCPRNPALACCRTLLRVADPRSGARLCESQQRPMAQSSQGFQGNRVFQCADIQQDQWWCARAFAEPGVADFVDTLRLVPLWRDTVALRAGGMTLRSVAHGAAWNPNFFAASRLRVRQVPFRVASCLSWLTSLARPQPWRRLWCGMS